MGVFGVDVSNHQSSFNFAGWDFAFIKSSEGNSFRDFRFTQHLNNARASNCLVAAYHYQRDVSAQSQVALIKEMVPTNVPVIIDVERGSGSLGITREIIRLLRSGGYESPFLYLPRWYWAEIGRPDLSGLPRLWASWYPDYVSRPREVGISLVPQSAWNDYGNNSVAMMQFTSTPHDMNWYPGTRDQLAAVLNGRAPGGGGTGDFLMALSPEQQQYIYDSLVDIRTDLSIPYTSIGVSTGNAVKYLYEAVNDIRNDLAKPYVTNGKSTGDLLTELDARLTGIETDLDNLAVGEIDYDRLAEAVANMIFDRLDVDIVRKAGQ